MVCFECCKICCRLLCIFGWLVNMFFMVGCGLNLWKNGVMFISISVVVIVLVLVSSCLLWCDVV